MKLSIDRITYFAELPDNIWDALSDKDQLFYDDSIIFDKLYSLLEPYGVNNIDYKRMTTGKNIYFELVIRDYYDHNLKKIKNILTNIPKMVKMLLKEDKEKNPENYKNKS